MNAIIRIILALFGIKPKPPAGEAPAPAPAPSPAPAPTPDVAAAPEIERIPRAEDYQEPAPLPPPAQPPVIAPPPAFLDTLRVQDPAKLSRADYEAAAARLGCEWEAIAAVAEVESGPLGAFDGEGRPIILFERHKFSTHSGRRFDQTHPHISNRQPGGYARGNAANWERLTEAYGLDGEAALRSASWGRFQLLGENYTDAQLSDAHAYVAEMAISQARQLAMFEAYIRAKGLADELRDKRWADFARRYNGPNYAQFQYDTKMANAYARLKQNPTV